MNPIETRLAELGVTLPDAPAPAANYVPFVVVGTLVHISGQISQDANGLIKGRLGEDMAVEQGAEAAKRCAISLLAQLKKACGGDLSRVVRAVKLTGFVNSTADFTDQPKVINGASDFLVAALGEAGRHARSAVSAASLPLGVAVEIEGIFESAEMPPRIPLPAAFLAAPIAHRALHDRRAGRIENSPAAIRAALDHGYAIEIDLQLSQDGIPMVFHDEELDRLTTETGPVSARRAAELQAIRLKDSTDTIPTLAQVLEMVSGRVPLLVEIKDQSLVMGPTDGRLEAATAAALAAYRGDVAVMSFNPACIAHMARLAPQIPRGLTTAAYDPEGWHPMPEAMCAHFRAIPDYDATGSSFISHEAADLTRPRVADLRAQGAAILCWTIRSPAEEAAARRIAQNVTFEGYLSPIPA